MQMQNIFLICTILGTALILLAKIIRGTSLGEAEQALLDSHKQCVADILELNKRILEGGEPDGDIKKAVMAITKAIRHNHKPGLLAKIADDTSYFIGLFTFERSYFESLYSADTHLNKFRDEVIKVFTASRERESQIMKNYPELMKSVLNQAFDDKCNIITIEERALVAAKRVNHPLKNSSYPKN